MRFFVLFLVVQIVASGADIYVSPTGLHTGAGTLLDPLSINKALGEQFVYTSPAAPGDTIWLMGGTYGTGGSQRWVTTVSGTPGSPVTVRSVGRYQTSGWAVLNGALWQYGTNTVFRDFEITNTSLERHVSDNERYAGLALHGYGNYVRNLVVHDTGNSGIGRSLNGGEIYGCIIWGNGIFDVDTGTPRGSGMYLQNTNELFSVEENISFRGFSTGMKAYTEGGYAENFLFRGNVAFYNTDDGIEVSSYTLGQSNIVVGANYVFDALKNRMGSYGNDGWSITLTNNYWVSEWRLPVETRKSWTNFIVTGNTFVVRTNVVPWGDPSSIAYWISTNVASATVDNNSYYGGPSNVPATPITHNTVAKTWANYKSATGWDANSTYSPNWPTEDLVVIRTNKYEVGRSHIVVFNWTDQNNKAVSLAGTGLVAGQQYRIYDVQNFSGSPILSGTYSDSSPNVSLPLTLTTAAQLIGDVSDLTTNTNINNHTSKLFNVFAVLPGAQRRASAQTLRTGTLRGK